MFFFIDDNRLHGSRRESANPMPVPSTVVRSAPSRSNGVNSEPKCSGAIPGPVSVTWIRSDPGSGRAQLIETVPPSRLYLIAFPSRFSRICLSRCRSAKM